MNIDTNEAIFLGLTLNQLVTTGLNVLGAIAILIGGWLIANWVSKLMRRGVEKNPRFDKTLGILFAQLARWGILIFTFIAVLNRFGVQTTQFVALLGAAGLAIGLALQGALSNVAAGVMLLGLRPFKVGDAVEISGTSGVVDEIGLFSTKMHTFDNIAIHIPNSSIIGTEIKNMSQNPTRRIDLTFGIGYSDDIGKAISIIQQELESDERILAEPAYRIGVTELADSSVNLLVWPWVKREDFLDVKLDLIRRLKERFDAEGINIPFPQRDLHIVGTPSFVQEVTPSRESVS